MRKGLQGLQRVAAAINDLYIYGVYPSNYPNLNYCVGAGKGPYQKYYQRNKKRNRIVR